MIYKTNEYLGYPDRISVPAGETVKFQLSSRRDAVKVEVLRLRCGDVDVNGPGFKYDLMDSAIDGVHACLDQEIRPGSCAVIEHGGTLVPSGNGWSFGCYIYPTHIADNGRGIMSNWCETTGQGYALELDSEGRPVLRLGSTCLTLDVKVRERVWSFISATLDLAKKTARLSLIVPADGTRPAAAHAKSFALPDVLPLDSGLDFLIAAHHLDPANRYTAHFDGKIEAPRIVSSSLEAEALRVLDCQPRTGAAAPGLVAFWDFGDGITTLDIKDLSANCLHGRLHQLPRRGVTGFFWSGAVHDFRLAPREYAAIHFHSDDIYDCQWQTTFTLDVPADWRTGVYALRLTPAGDEPEPDCESYVTFFVTPGKQTKRADLVVVLSVATYLAYANSALRLYQVHFETLMEHVLWLPLDDVYMQEHPQIGQSTYDSHVDGSGRAYSSWLRPVLSMRPRGYWFNMINDTHILDWLEEKGIAYDVITDVELDREGARALRPYRAMMTPTHAEYYSFNMMNGIMDYQNGGGRHISMGGNAFYWRCGFHPAAPAALEVRRGMAGTRTWESEPGEVHLAGTGEPGALWRHSGFAPQKLVGTGFSAMINDTCTYYVRTPDSEDPRAAFIFEGTGRHERFGDFGFRYGGAVGSEIDRLDYDLGTPRHALLIATSEGLGAGALPTPEEFRTMVDGLDGTQNALVRADMVFFETGNGGAVFASGSITFGMSLGHNNYDNNISTITLNVVKRFLDPEPFVLPALT
ncbi:N,N-dimethylformamidase beta subunit family domain-containing protein [Rhizobium sp. SSA_523]|uniref:N,N-dimethylformamidase beta subunit family domain-containing protein n=1 Tax=Rhizobium sp. SSA_523 TaxID=2952477 RepID=UPI0020905267|nr:N,N-dimethylformamidase beta subunit family domain-containing protein [Rhizobium sp. SSA_523]MCO5733309.1 N,N-dimethylformamidase [Rhizobium sp. SSA_523]WKC21708.1 N,N-dimethylformamidase [Rhizobium sp. SSA_523]